MPYEAVLDALGHPTRRSIFDRLRARPRSVGDLAGEVPVSRPAVSQHLKVLKEAGLVVDRQEGTRRVYRVDPAGLADLRAYVEGLWDQALKDFKDLAEWKGERR
jgi:DNA-binding transcriptional ArsR family regulator